MRMGFYHRIHGDVLHDLVITRAERYVVLNGGKLLSIDGFKDKYHCACEPDVFCYFMDRKLGKQLIVVEVESRPTEKSIRKKWTQYKESSAGIDHLVILNLSGLLTPNNWTSIDYMIKQEMPY